MDRENNRLTAATVLLILLGFVLFCFVSKTEEKKRKGNSWGRVALLVHDQCENCSELAVTR